MKIAAPGQPHLGYCSNIHPGESWAEVRAALERWTVRVKQMVGPDAPFGVGLRLSARAADELSAPGAFEELKAFFARAGLYVFSINGFSYGSFHATRVKEKVYLPDWLDDARLVYTGRLGALLARMLPEGVVGSISTVPLAFRARVRGAADEEAMAVRILRVVAALRALFDRTGRTIALALEPEPFCRLETTAEAIRFFEERLLAPFALRFLANLLGADLGTAELVVRRHAGVCLDLCHMAVEFEDAGESLDALAKAGIAVHKIQISAGLEARWEDRSESLASLGSFANDVYLHQVTERKADGALERWLDLPDALASAREGRAPKGPWRVHCHVPLFRERLGALAATQSYVADVLDRVRRRAVCPHLEVETYTWDVLPEEHKGEDVAVAIARELAWVKDRLVPRAASS